MLEEQHKKFRSGGDKMRNSSGHQYMQGENECSEKKVNENTYDISCIKSFWKFHVVVVQNNGKEMYKTSVLHVRSCFFANKTCCCFSPYSGVAFAALSITRFYIYFEETINIIENFDFNPG